MRRRRTNDLERDAASSATTPSSEGAGCGDREHANRGGFGDGGERAGRFRGAAGRGKRPEGLHADVAVDEEVVVAVDDAVVVEIAVLPAGEGAREAGVDAEVIVAVELPVEVRVA